MRTITISARHILEHPWERVAETLRHEMAHQYAEEVLGISGAPAHGEPFQRACELLRVDAAPHATREALGRLEESSDERDKILARVKLLLALARSPNEHEAANAMRMANKYLLEYNLEVAEAETERRFETRHLGHCSSRVQEYEYVLAHILQDHFFVCVIWTYSFDAIRNKMGRILQIHGTRENLEMAEYVYHYVMHVSARLWEEHRRSSGARGGTKLQYLAGLIRGLEEKLDRQKVELKDERGLVWLGDPKLGRYYRYMNPHVRTTSTSGVSRGERYNAGLRDGREINIHKGIGGRAARRGRLLPGG